MIDPWLNFDDLRRDWLERRIFLKLKLPLEHSIDSYLEDHSVQAFLLPEDRMEAVMNRTDVFWADLAARHPLLAEGHKHFLAPSLRRSAGLKLLRWDGYMDKSQQVVVERKEDNSGYIKRKGTLISRKVLVAYAERMGLKLGFLIDSYRYTERPISEVAAIDEEFRSPNACFRMLRQDQGVVGRPRMQVRSIFSGKAFA